MAFIKIVTRNVKFNSFLILNSAKIKNKMALKIVTLQRNIFIHSYNIFIRSFYHIIYIGYMEGALLLVRRPRVDVVGVFIDDYTWSIQFIILLYST